MKLKALLLCGLAGVLAACAAPSPNEPKAEAPAVAAPIAVTVPSGVYKNDPNHTSFSFAVQHLGLAPYEVTVAKVAAEVTVDAANPTASKVTVKADPASVRTTYSGNYSATHKGSPYRSWEEALAKQFLGAEKTPEITFVSTGLTLDGGDAGTLTGDLTMAGVTKPVTFKVRLTGQAAAHPFTQTPALGLTAEGVVKRGDFGIAPDMNQFLGEDVTVRFSADFIGAPPAAPEAAKQ